MGTQDAGTPRLSGDASNGDLARKYWTEHSTNANENEMVLDSQGQVLSEHEVPELLSYLPDFSGDRVLELGAGIGRYTGHLADTAGEVTAVDFMESFISKNRETNNYRGNVNFKQADVMDLEYPENNFQLVFSNWLLMYLTDHQVVLLLRRILSWLSPGGHIFFRESCFHQSGNKSRTNNPTQYRSAAKYHELVQAATGDGARGRYKLLCCKPVEAYIKLKQNRNQLCWLMAKAEPLPEEGAKLQAFLDNQQYGISSILKYERVFGEHFISPGGKETTEEFLGQLNLQSGQQVLDVGSGIGGSAFLMAQKYGVKVTGIDLSTNMVCLAMERANQQPTSQVQFEICDAATKEYEPESFDVIYSRDTILHIKKKRSLFTSFLSWLKPGGSLFITDYCCSEGVHSDQFTEYVTHRGYSLFSVDEYRKVLQEVGFTDLVVEDRTEQFIEVLTKELARTEADKECFIKDFSEDDYNDIVNSWKSKIARCRAGDQRWGVIYARKSTSTSAAGQMQ